MENFSIVGAGGHTRSLIQVLDMLNWNAKGIYDNSFSGLGELILNVPVVGTLDDIPEDEHIIISTGDLKLKQELVILFGARVAKENIIHPDTAIGLSCILGDSNQIFSRAILNACSIIGNHNIINTAAILEHEVSIGNYCHISVGAIVLGRVTIGNNCFIGAGAVINDGVSICDNVICGSNSTVIRSIVEPGVYVGSPAVRIK